MDAPFYWYWMIEPTSLCDELVAFFEARPENHAWKIAGGLNPESKSLDLTIRPRELQQADHLPVEYLDALFACHQII